MTGGLTHLLIPSPTNLDQWETITDVTQMEQLLLQQSRTHFSQARGTPYTVPPLTEVLTPDGLSNFGDRIMAGEPIPQELPVMDATRLLLQHQHSLLPPTVTMTKPLEFEALMAGFKKWPERTTTSPSGRHLGIYKSLLKDRHTEKPGEVPTTKGIDIMNDIF